MVSVWFYAANLIGYFRIITGIVGFYFYKSNPFLFIFFYFLSYIADALDGYAARSLNQCSKFGACLDMTTDRFCSSGLLIVLAYYYPDETYYYILLVILDIVSHWTQMYATLATGASSHKNMTKNDFFLLRLYYTNRVCLFTVCLLTEAFYLCRYILATINHPTLSFLLPYKQYIVYLEYICFPVLVFKLMTSVLGYINSSKKIVNYDEEEARKKISESKKEN